MGLGGVPLHAFREESSLSVVLLRVRRSDSLRFHCPHALLRCSGTLGHCLRSSKTVPLTTTLVAYAGVWGACGSDLQLWPCSPSLSATALSTQTLVLCLSLHRRQMTMSGSQTMPTRSCSC
jgi:hypothetical protein